MDRPTSRPSPAPPRPVPVKGRGPYLEQTLSSEDRAKEHAWPLTLTTKAPWWVGGQTQHCSKQTLKVQFPHFWVLLKGTTAST